MSYHTEKENSFLALACRRAEMNDRRPSRKGKRRCENKDCTDPVPVLTRRTGPHPRSIRGAELAHRRTYGIPHY